MVFNEFLQNWSDSIVQNGEHLSSVGEHFNIKHGSLTNSVSDEGRKEIAIK